MAQISYFPRPKGLFLRCLLLLAATTNLAEAAASRDFYRILGIPRRANKQMIKKAYRNLSMKWHPDKNPENPAKAQKKMLEINAAYEVLSDPTKKKKYDRYGEDGIREDGGGGGGGGGFDEDIFSHFFGGGGHGGGGGRHRHQRRSGGQNMFGKTENGVLELGPKSMKALEEDPRRNILVYFYDSNDEDFEEHSDMMLQFGEKYVSSGLVKAGVVNCGKHGDICDKHGIDETPDIVYLGAKGHTKNWNNNHISLKSMASFFPAAQPMYVKVLKNENELRIWYRQNDKLAHLVFFSDKKTIPPMLKTLSIEFHERALIGVFLGGAMSLAEKMKVKSRPALIHIRDEDSLSGDLFDGQFKKEPLVKFVTRAIGKQRAQSAVVTLKELTKERFGGGDCGETDSNFCLILISLDRDTSGERAALRMVAQKLVKDPVKVFYVTDHNFASAFADADNVGEDAVVSDDGQVLLLRPKRKRFKLFTGDATNPDELFSFVDSAVGGGAPLPERLQASPSFTARNQEERDEI